MGFLNCSNCSVHVEERPLYRQNPKGESPAVMWCEPCVLDGGRSRKTIEIVDLIDAENNKDETH